MPQSAKVGVGVSFLSTLSLRRATPAAGALSRPRAQFLSTLSLRRATSGGVALGHLLEISIHALLAESDTEPYTPSVKGARISIHALLAESDNARCWARQHPSRFLSTLSLRRATAAGPGEFRQNGISIHALLAESDGACIVAGPVLYYLYLRSPCGERRRLRQRHPQLLAISIHALLAESDPAGWRASLPLVYFYPRSPCGERLDASAAAAGAPVFLSTLSLRRATGR